MNIISFAWTTEALLCGQKSVTRRDWSDNYAAKFHVSARCHGPGLEGRARAGHPRPRRHSLAGVTLEAGAGSSASSSWRCSRQTIRSSSARPSRSRFPRHERGAQPSRVGCGDHS